VSRAASPARAVAATTLVELRLAARRGETLLLTLAIPLGVLVVFSTFVGIGGGDAVAVDRVLPATIALAIVATSFTGLGITTGYDRHYGVLKRLGGSPLSRAEWIIAKVLSVLLVEAVQVALLVGVATLLGWRAPPGGSPGLFLAGVVLGTVTFAALGLLLAGLLRAEAMLAAANGLFLVALVLGGSVVPPERLPGPLGALSAVLPPAPLTELISAGLGAGDISGSILVLAGWSLGATFAAAATFRWN
jgi:ABC-2 type transport system permease protein